MKIIKLQRGGNFNVSKPIEYKPIIAQPLQLEDIKLYSKPEVKKPEIDKEDLVKEGKGHTGATNAYMTMLKNIENQIYNLDDLDIMSGRGKSLISKYKQLASPEYKNALEQQLKKTEESLKKVTENEGLSELFVDTDNNIYYTDAEGNYGKMDFSDFVLQQAENAKNNKPENIKQALTVAEFYDIYDKEISSDIFNNKNDLSKSNVRLSDVVGTKYVQDLISKYAANLGVSGRENAWSNIGAITRDVEGKPIFGIVSGKQGEENNLQQVNAAAKSFEKDMGKDVLNYFKTRAFNETTPFYERFVVDDKQLNQQLDKIYAKSDENKFNEALSLLLKYQKDNPKKQISIETELYKNDKGELLIKPKSIYDAELNQAALSLANAEFDRFKKILPKSDYKVDYDKGLNEQMVLGGGGGSDKTIDIGQHEKDLIGAGGKTKDEEVVMVKNNKTGKIEAKSIEIPAYNYNAWRPDYNNTQNKLKVEGKPVDILTVNETFGNVSNTNDAQVRSNDRFRKINEMDNMQFYVDKDKSDAKIISAPYDENNNLLLHYLTEVTLNKIKGVKIGEDGKIPVNDEQLLNISVANDVKQNTYSQFENIVSNSWIDESTKKSLESKFKNGTLTEKDLSTWSQDAQSKLLKLQSDYKNVDNVIKVKWQPTIKVDGFVQRQSNWLWADDRYGINDWLSDDVPLTTRLNAKNRANLPSTIGDPVIKKTSIYIPTSRLDMRYGDNQPVKEPFINAEIQNLINQKVNPVLPSSIDLVTPEEFKNKKQ